MAQTTSALNDSATQTAPTLYLFGARVQVWTGETGTVVRHDGDDVYIRPDVGAPGPYIWSRGQVTALPSVAS